MIRPSSTAQDGLPAACWTGWSVAPARVNAGEESTSPDMHASILSRGASAPDPPAISLSPSWGLPCPRQPRRAWMSLDTVPATPPAGVLGDFRLIREMGRSGRGWMYEAEQCLWAGAWP